MFRINTEYYVEFLTAENMTLLGSTESKINKDENGNNVSPIGITGVVLVHCNTSNKSYLQDSRVLYIFIPNKPFSELLDISLKIFIFSKTFNLEFSYFEVWFTDQNSWLRDIEDKININLIIN